MRLKPFYSQDRIEVGLDEAGRGCLAGPVFAAAVILNPFDEIVGLNDSKQLGVNLRNTLEGQIKSQALGYAVAMCTNEEIDDINILRASLLAMHRALDTIKHSFDLILVDGNRFNQYKKKEHITIIKGDTKFQSIAAASILAKCARDSYMESIDLEYKEYFWKKNKGYPTKEHRKAIMEYGACPYHRKSFKLLADSQIEIFNRL